jgi:membrane-bound metal-dependent hydrolase YbcI (DUF457 family)
MLIRTHLAIVIFAMLLFIQHVNHQILFVFVTLIATLLPDVDSAFSTLGKGKAFRIIQFFVAHRGPIHSFSFCVVISVLLALFVPILSFGFFLGYGVHLFVDSFTKEGIVPFWPYPKKSSGPLKTGGLMESSIFLIFVLIDIVFAGILLF